jgi:hypothetical protein
VPDPKPNPDDKPAVRPLPAAPELTLHSPGATADHLLGANGEVRIGGLASGARWSYSLDAGKTWHDGVGTTLAPAALGEDAGKSLRVVRSTPRTTAVPRRC